MSEYQEDFLSAIESGDLEAVKSLLDEHRELLELRPQAAPSTPLLALYHGRSDVARFLVEQGASVSIFEAAALGLVEDVAALLDQSRELVNAYNVDGFQPLGLACFFDQPGAARILLARGAEINSASRNQQLVMPLHSAVAAANFDLVQLLISHGADVNARQQGGFTALHAAARSGLVQIVEALVAAGAELDAVTEQGLRPVDLASEEVARALTDT